MLFPSILMDVVALGIIAVCVFLGIKRGFLRSIINFFGTFAVLVLSFFAARALAPFIFRQFFYKGMESRIAELIQTYAIDNARTLLDSLVGFLPEQALEGFVASLNGSLDFAAPNIADQVMEKVVAPVIVPFIAVITFVALFIVLWLALKLLSLLAKAISALPVIGGLNRFLGGVVGVLIACIYLFLLLCIVWAYDWMSPDSPVGQLWFSRSVLWNLASPVNIFSFIH